MTERERIEVVLRGGEPDRIPWATRLDIWHSSCLSTGRLPARYQGWSLMDIHRDLGIGRQAYVQLALTRLRGALLSVEVNGRLVSREKDPVLRFPAAVDKVPMDEPGDVDLYFDTPAGRARVRYRITTDILESASLPYMSRHILADDSDWPAVEWLLGRSEVVEDFQAFTEREAEIGDFGLTVGMITRTPFQRLILDFMGEVRAFYQMYDEPSRFARLLDRLTEIDEEFIRVSCSSPALLVEYSENVDGEITNPKLFERYCLPAYRRSSDRLHAAGKLLGCHLDGDLSNLLELIAESGVDVAESFSPEPLSRVLFEDAWKVWKGRVLMWGVLPSPIFEAEVGENEFEDYVRKVLRTASAGGPLILGIADQAISLTLPDRVRRAAELIEEEGRYHPALKAETGGGGNEQS
jgi:hypothetical protein